MHPETTKRLVQSLQDPAVLGGEGLDVRTLQTHMSWILLAGPHSYKIKKPIDLGFADFSTLDKRRHFCNVELRVNRRLAAELYLGVVPIRGTPEAPTLGDGDGGDGDGDGDGGDPIEYAVKMKRFSQDALLARALRRGALTRRHIDDLVGQIADFHERVAVDVNGRGFGTPEAVRKPMGANFDTLIDFVDDERLAVRLQRLRQWSEQELREKKQAFVARKRRGFVRECHGDMHLGNMILLNDSVVVFDAIEFNEGLRWIDVQNDLAFLVMDLEDRGRPDLARRVLNGYLEITGDYEGLTVMRYYLAYRALVRAKVAAIRLGQQGVDARQREQLQKELRGYVDLADRYSAATPPILIITHGLSASGKTTGTGRLVEELGAIRIRSDVERKRLFNLEPLAATDSEVNQGLYSPQSTQRCYASLAEIAATVVQAGFTVIVDAAFLDHTQRGLLANTADGLGVPFLILDFHADEATLRSRIARRQASDDDASEAGLAVLEDQLRSRHPLSTGERKTAIRINSSEPHWQESLLKAVRQRFSVG